MKCHWLLDAQSEERVLQKGNRLTWGVNKHAELKDPGTYRRLARSAGVKSGTVSPKRARAVGGFSLKPAFSIRQSALCLSPPLKS